MYLGNKSSMSIKIAKRGEAKDNQSMNKSKSINQ